MAAVSQRTLELILQARDQTKQALDSARKSIEQFAQKQKLLNQQFGDATPAVQQVNTSFSSMVGTLRKVGIAFAGLLAAKKVIDVLKGIGDAAGQVEELSIQLEVLFGNAEDAVKAAAAIENFAARSRFSLQEIQQAAGSVAVAANRNREAFVQLLPLIEDFANISGLTFQQTAEQIQRAFSAGIGAADLFREKGISAMLGFQAGAQVSAEETRKRFLEFWQENTKTFEQAREKMANSWSGLMSFIQDRLFKLKTEIAQAGIFDALKKGIKVAIDFLTKLASHGRAIGQTMLQLGKAFLDVGKAIVGTFADIFRAIFAGTSSSQSSLELLANTAVRVARLIATIFAFVRVAISSIAALARALGAVLGDSLAALTEGGKALFFLLTGQIDKAKEAGDTARRILAGIGDEVRKQLAFADPARKAFIKSVQDLVEAFTKDIKFTPKKFQFTAITKDVDILNKALVGTKQQVADTSAKTRQKTEQIKESFEKSKKSAEDFKKALSSLNILAGQFLVQFEKAETVQGRIVALTQVVEIQKERVKLLEEAYRFATEQGAKFGLSQDVIGKQIATLSQKIGLFETKLSALQQIQKNQALSTEANIGALQNLSLESLSFLSQAEKLQIKIDLLKNTQQALTTEYQNTVAMLLSLSTAQKLDDKTKKELIATASLLKEKIDKSAVSIQGLERELAALTDTSGKAKAFLEGLASVFEKLFQATGFGKKLQEIENAFKQNIESAQLYSTILAQAGRQEEAIKEGLEQTKRALLEKRDALFQLIQTENLSNEMKEKLFQQLVVLEQQIGETERQIETFDLAMKEGSKSARDVTEEMGKAEASFQDLARAIQQAAVEGQGFFGAIQSGVDVLIRDINKKLSEDFANRVAATFQQIGEQILAMFQKIGSGIENAFSKIGIKIPGLGGLVGFIVSSSGLIGKVVNKVKDWGTKVVDFITGRRRKKQWEEIKRLTQELVNIQIRAVKQFDEVADTLPKTGGQALNAFTQEIDQFLKEAEGLGRKDRLNFLRNAFQKAGQDFEALVKKMEELMQAFAEFIKNIVGSALSDSLKITNLNEAILAFTKTLKERIFDAITQPLIDAFLKAAIVKRTLAPIFDAIQVAAETIETKGFAFAEAVLKEGIAAFQQQLPALESFFSLVQGIATDIRSALFPQPATALAGSSVTINQNFILNNEIASDVDIDRFLNQFSERQRQEAPDIFAL